ncbi:cleavage and polyadenylation specificity factor subunit 6 isoform X2 [Thalassophryne amazonica]|uniref:cleavage and polyadenylation specificity factor subunit 6 isoform X2 n=1 Tax=Thalassophryne amazonica TaxID=390379 RepID=UPI001471B611|nr:cleavage and polyadenylation specificity factor subunit 6 isoform X2 [Thalassophryne amazonica]
MEIATEGKMASKTESEKPVTESKHRFRRGSKGRGHGKGVLMNRGGTRGGRAMMKVLIPPGRGRGQGKDGAINGFAPMRRMVRMRPYPELRGHRGRGGPMGMRPLPLPPLPMHFRDPFLPMPRHRLPPPPPPPPPPRGHPAFGVRPPHPRGRGMPPPRSPHYFSPRGLRGYHSGLVSPPLHLPPGRGQRWPGPPRGRWF